MNKKILILIGGLLVLSVGGLAFGARTYLHNNRMVKILPNSAASGNHLYHIALLSDRAEPAQVLVQTGGLCAIRK